MNDPLTQFEAGLRQARPAEPDPRLESRIARELDAAPAPSAPRLHWPTWRWWARLGALAILAVITALLLNRPPGRLASGSAPELPVERVGAPSLAAGPARGAARFQRVQAANYLVNAEDDGIVYASIATPLRKVRYQYLATSRWKARQGNTTVEVIVPGEETILVPMDIR